MDFLKRIGLKELLIIAVFYIVLLFVLPSAHGATICYNNYNVISGIYARIRVYRPGQADTSFATGYNAVDNTYSYALQYSFTDGSPINYVTVRAITPAELCSYPWVAPYAGKPMSRSAFITYRWPCLSTSGAPHMCNGFWQTAYFTYPSQVVVDSCIDMVPTTDSVQGKTFCMFREVGTFPAMNDWDCDGYTTLTNPVDCSVCNPSRYPGAVEICGNSIDEDCNGSDLACQQFSPSSGLAGLGLRERGMYQFKSGRKGRGMGGYEIQHNN